MLRESFLVFLVHQLEVMMKGRAFGKQVGSQHPNGNDRPQLGEFLSALQLGSINIASGIEHPLRKEGEQEITCFQYVYQSVWQTASLICSQAWLELMWR